MGKGDKKTRRGKIIQGSYGVSRPKNKKKNTFADVKTDKPKAELHTPKKQSPKVIEEVKKSVIEAEVEQQVVLEQSDIENVADKSEVKSKKIVVKKEKEEKPTEENKTTKKLSKKKEE